MDTNCAELIPYGYAPGNYTCQCFECGGLFTGDKRAICCFVCAEQRFFFDKLKVDLAAGVPPGGDPVEPEVS